MVTLKHDGEPTLQVRFYQERESDDPLSANLPFYVYEIICLPCGLGYGHSIHEQAMRDAYIDPVQMAITEAEVNLSNHGCDHARLLRPQIEAIVKNPFRT